MSTTPTPSEIADRLEEEQLRVLGERVVMKSLLYHLADGERTLGVRPGRGPLQRPMLMGTVSRRGEN